jgi:hypothetical protein
MFAKPLPFPNYRPNGYQSLVREPRFEPDRHLALEAPKDIWSLQDFGYDDRTIAACVTDIAVAGPFRLLSDEGVVALREVALALRAERTLGNRTASFLTGGVYRSSFLRDLCQSPEVAEFLSRLSETPLAPHSLPSQQAYINYAPDDVSRAVDTWHIDSIGLDYVLMVSDPSTFEGGDFQFFRGTTREAATLFGTTVDRLTDGFQGTPPNHRIEALDIPGPGYAWFQQGDLVLHRATRLTRPAERITMVVGYVPLDIRYADATKVTEIATWGEPGLLSELARHGAWLACAKLERLIAEPPTKDDPKVITEALGAAIADVERLIAHWTPSPGPSGPD